MLDGNTGIIKNTKKIENADEFQESFEKAAERMKEGYIIAMLTDRFDIQRLEEETFDRGLLYKKAMEIRMFNKNGEVKWFRGRGQALWCRSIIEDTENMNDLDYWDEEQYLDIDTKKTKLKSESDIVYATGGGRYPLPLEKYEDAKIKIRNYLKYEDDTKQLYISDWRVLGFVNEEER